MIRANEVMIYHTKISCPSGAKRWCHHGYLHHANQHLVFYKEVYVLCCVRASVKETNPLSDKIKLCQTCAPADCKTTWLRTYLCMLKQRFEYTHLLIIKDLICKSIRVWTEPFRPTKVKKNNDCVWSDHFDLSVDLFFSQKLVQKSQIIF